MNSDTIWELTPTKNEAARAIPPEGVHALTTSTRLPNDELGASGKSLEVDTRPYRRRGYFVRSPRRVRDRLKTAAFELALIAMLMAGFIIAALFAVDLLGMR
jgi:hypothetical protein